MFKLINKVDCTGCNVCGDICPHNAISFVNDKEGFWYPHINMELCVDCGLCNAVCPVISDQTKIQRFEVPIVYAAYSKDEKIRIDSTSGGVHSMLALNKLANHAYIGGAIYNEDHTVSHILSNKFNDLEAIRSSKYLQSYSLGIYRQIKEKLNNGNEVFFCGTPCQVQRTHRYKSQEHGSGT